MSSDKLDGEKSEGKAGKKREHELWKKDVYIEN